jgi:integrase
VGVIATNPTDAAEPPRVKRAEIEILSPDQIKTVLHALRGRSLYSVALIGLATGMRRGEIVALRWRDIDLEMGKVRVERSLEQTASGLVFKEPKTKAGRRTIGIPPSIVAELREHWRRQQERRLALGVGKAGPDDLVVPREDDLVVPREDGSPWPPDRLPAEVAESDPACAQAHSRQPTNRGRPRRGLSEPSDRTQ